MMDLETLEYRKIWGSFTFFFGIFQFYFVDSRITIILDLISYMLKLSRWSMSVYVKWVFQSFPIFDRETKKMAWKSWWWIPDNLHEHSRKMKSQYFMENKKTCRYISTSFIVYILEIELVENPQWQGSYLLYNLLTMRIKMDI